MKFVSVFAFFILQSFALFGQNLVPNPSFENYRSRPQRTLEDYEIDTLLYGWISPTKASPDFYVYLTDSSNIDNYVNINLGRQKAYDGNVFVGLLLQIYFGEYISFDHIYYREYIQAKLNKPLKKGSRYLVSMYYKLSERCTYAVDGLGIYFSKDKIKSNLYLLDYKPQISNNDGNILTNYQWERLAGYFIPDDKMNYITIGNFKRFNPIHFKQVQPKDSIKSPYAYYLIDKIEVFEVGPNDTSLYFKNYNQKTETPIETIKINKIKLDSLNLKGAIIKNDTIVLSDILFEFGKARLLPEHFPEFRKIVKYLYAFPNISVTIEGHTDSIGDHQINLKLSLDRANSVAAFIIDNGIDKSRIKTFGYGETKPISDNGSEEGRSKNRRVEIIFKKGN